MAQTIKELVHRITKELPNLDPHSTRNSTPKREYKITLKDANDVVIDTIDVQEGEQDNWIGFNFAGTVVASWEDATDVEVIEEYRREDRQEKFAETLDTLNPAWYDNLTDDQKARIKAFREAWLDYPDTGTIPDSITYNEGQPDETTVSTDITDIFPHA